MKRLGGLLGLLFGWLFAATMITIIVTIAIWPGEAKLTAPILCPDDRTEAIVVRDETNPRPGETSINYTLYCVGERGEATDVGFFRPFALLVVFHGLIVVLLMLVLGLRRRGRRSPPTHEDAPDGDGDERPWVGTSTAGPFVD